MVHLNDDALCKDCLGCNKLEDNNFVGVNICNNYIKGLTNKEKLKDKAASNEPWDKYVSKYVTK